MPESSVRAAPRLVVSRPIEVPDASVRHRRPRRRTESKEHGRTSSSEWSDVEESPPRRRRSKRPSRRGQPSLGQSDNERGSTSSLGRFLPRLGRISENVESASTSQRSSTRSSHRRRQRDRSPITHPIPRESSTSRPPRYRVQRRPEKSFKINPSLLSVASTATGLSDKSSGSGSTITQDSYDRDRMDEPEKAVVPPESSKANVFDFIETSSTVDVEDTHSVASSGPSSHYVPSDAGSSQAPETPSSQSTLPSPPSIRRLSGSEIRAKYDKDYAASSYSVRSSSRSPDPSLLSMRHRPSVEDIPEHGEEDTATAISGSEVQPAPRPRSSSQSSTRSSRRPSERWLYQEEAMRQHMAYVQQGGQYVDPAYAVQRTQSPSPVHAEPSPYQQHMAIQHFQWPSPPPGTAYAAAAVAPPDANGNITHVDKPEAPAAPDLSKRTLLGYELMALELSDPKSSVKPIYRKFEYLNHRILLHLQDEICELEDQLRQMDEVIAQMHIDSASGEEQPSSRRGEAWNGHDFHHRRTELLGRIFLKIEQYNRAMSSYTSMSRDAASAEPGLVESYRHWVIKHKPIHEVETRYLDRQNDLILPAQVVERERPGKHVALAYLPVALMLPLLLFSLIPTLGGRLLVTLLIAGGAFLVAATTRIRMLMCSREWAVCGTVYVLLMAAIAGCIPQYST